MKYLFLSSGQYDDYTADLYRIPDDMTEDKVKELYVAYQDWYHNEYVPTFRDTNIKYQTFPTFAGFQLIEESDENVLFFYDDM